MLVVTSLGEHLLLSASPPQLPQPLHALSAAHVSRAQAPPVYGSPMASPFFLRDQDLRGTMSPCSVHPDMLRDKLPKQLVWTHVAQREKELLVQCFTNGARCSPGCVPSLHPPRDSAKHPRCELFMLCTEAYANTL